MFPFPDSNTWSLFLVGGELLVLFLGSIGGYIGLRSALTRNALRMQETVRQSLLDENEILQHRLDRVEADLAKAHEENEKFVARFNAIVLLLEQRGMILVLDNSTVHIKDKKKRI